MHDGRHTHITVKQVHFIPLKKKEYFIRIPIYLYCQNTQYPYHPNPASLHHLSKRTPKSRPLKREKIRKKAQCLRPPHSPHLLLPRQPYPNHPPRLSPFFPFFFVVLLPPLLQLLCPRKSASEQMPGKPPPPGTIDSGMNGAEDFLGCGNRVVLSGAVEV